MAITVPATPTLADLDDASSLAISKKATFENVLQTQNYAFAHTGARIPGHYYPSAATTTSSTLTQANATSGQPDLDVWFPTSQLIRLTDDAGSDAVHIECQIYGAQVEVRISLVVLGLDATLTTLTVTRASSALGWSSASKAIPWSNTFDGGVTSNPKRNFAYKIEYKATSGTASLLTWAVHEKHLVAADLPDG